MNFRKTLVDFLFFFYLVLQSAQCIKVSPFAEFHFADPSPDDGDDFDCVCGYAPYPVIYGSVQAAAAEATSAAFDALVCGNSSDSSHPEMKYRVTDYQCYCGKKFYADTNNFKELKGVVTGSAAKYKAKPSSGSACPPKFQCICGYLIFPQVYGSMSAAISAATKAAVADSSDCPSNPNPPSDYAYLKSHFNISDFQCYCSLPFNLGDTSELQALTLAAAIQYKVPQATKPSCDTCSVPGTFECACGFPLFPKTYNSLSAAVARQSCVASKDLAKPNCPSGDLCTYKLTDNQCFCTQSWYGGNFEELNQQTNEAFKRYGVSEAIQQSPSK